MNWSICIKIFVSHSVNSQFMHCAPAHLVKSEYGKIVILLTVSLNSHSYATYTAHGIKPLQMTVPRISRL